MHHNGHHHAAIEEHERELAARARIAEALRRAIGPDAADAAALRRVEQGLDRLLPRKARV